jgi:hypothetical protein
LVQDTKLFETILGIQAPWRIARVALDTSGERVWTYTNWQCIIPVPTAVNAGEGLSPDHRGYGAGSAMIKVEKKKDGSYAVSELFKNPDFGAHTQPPVLHDGHFCAHLHQSAGGDRFGLGRPIECRAKLGAGAYSPITFSTLSRPMKSDGFLV